ncbi:MAG: hypothetical protein JWP92_3738 [Caulobacter sp.]|nr:hypothetical protein [Caulobacter sp.]
MSRDASIRLDWGDDEFLFKVGIGQWRKIQERCDAGPGEIYRRLISVATALQTGASLAEAASFGMIGDWRIDDVREVILQALVGGGLSEIQAAVLVRDRVDKDADFKVHLALAFAIVRAALGDVPDEAVGEKPGRAKRRAPSRAARSGSRPSTPTA